MRTSHRFERLCQSLLSALRKRSAKQKGWSDEQTWKNDVIVTPTFADLDRDEQRILHAVCELTGMTLDKWDKLDEVQREPWLEGALQKLSSEADGPFGINCFRWKTLMRCGLAPTPFRLLTHLWNATDRTRSFRDLAKDVWDDAEINLRNDYRIGSARREVNDFMEAGRFPFRVQISSKNELVTLTGSTALVSN